MDKVEENLEERISLCETLDRVLNTGVVLQGDIIISVADVDLVFLGLQLVLTSADRAGFGRARLAGVSDGVLK
jgi:hypothetical protein